MIRSPRSSAIKAFANLKADEFMWGMPESPEFSAVQRLMNEFQTHEREEERWLSGYKKTAGSSNDPLVRFLLDLIIADEERHRDLIKRMIASLKDDLAWTQDRGAARIKRKTKPEGKTLLAAVERFLAMERNGVEEYEKLMQSASGFQRELFSLLCKAMVHDSLKHIGILEFLRRHLRASERAARRRRSGREKR